MFESLAGMDRRGIPGRLTSMLVSICLHAGIVVLAIVLPLIFLNAMPDGVLLAFLMAEPAVPKTPEPPAPPQPASRQANAVKIEAEWNEKPAFIPDHIPAPDVESVAFGAVLNQAGIGLGNGGNAGLTGASGITAWGLIPAAPPPILPPVAPPHREYVHTGGSVQEAKLIKQVVPEYPALARNARVQDIVLLEVTLDEEGNVAGVRIIKGHPLLVDAAVRAVKQWKYSPTLLNGEPVPVISTVTVIFRLY